MDMRLKEEFLKGWDRYFGGAELPITCWYTDDEGAANPAGPAKEHRCLIADLAKIRKGESARFDVAAIGCAGGKRYLGFEQEVPPNFEHFFRAASQGYWRAYVIKISRPGEGVRSAIACLHGAGPIRRFQEMGPAWGSR